MRDDVWLNKIRAENRRSLGLEGFSGGARSAEVLYHPPQPSGARPPTTQPLPAAFAAQPVALGSYSELANAPTEAWRGILMGVGITCAISAYAFKHKPRTRKQLLLAGFGAFALALLKKGG